MDEQEPTFRPAMPGRDRPGPQKPAAATEPPPAGPAKPASGRETPDHALRPRTLAEFVGQRPIVENLGLAIQAARGRDEPVDHILLSGLPGLGKTTLAAAVAREQGVGFKEVSGPNIERPADLAGILMALQPGDVFFIDEIHALRPQVEEYLYSAMEDFRLVIVLDQAARARTVPLTLKPFTLVGATTREGLLSAPFRARFGIHERLEPYTIDDLQLVVARSARLLGLDVADDAARLIADRARGTPRIVNHFLRRARDLAQVREHGGVDVAIAEEALRRVGADAAGLFPLDRKILEILLRSSPHPVGLKTLAVSIGEEPRTIEDVYEPFLIREGFVAKTPRGRVLTARGLEHLGHAPERGHDAVSQPTLFPE